MQNRILSEDLSYKTLLVDLRDDGILTITLNRPDKKNAVDLVMREELFELSEIIRKDKMVRVVILTGAGDGFCSGGDIAMMKAEHLKTSVPDANSARRRMMDNINLISNLLTLEIPLISAVNGFAFGAGFNIALTADFVICSQNATFSQSFTRLGLVPDAAGMYTLPRLVGIAKAKELIFTCCTIDADEALKLGIVQQVYPGDELLSRAIEMAQGFLKSSPLALAFSKKILNRSLQSNFPEVLEQEAMAQGICGASSFHQNAVSNFLNRKKS